MAVTGGPGAGKTAVLEIARRSLCRHVIVLPESAGIVFGGGFPRGTSVVARRASQRTIYHVQFELQRLVLEEQRVAIALCDRGTVDLLAYWCGEADDLWRDVNSDLQTEIARSTPQSSTFVRRQRSRATTTPTHCESSRSTKHYGLTR